MLLMVEKGIWGGLCHAIHRYAKSNNKYMTNYDKNIECNSVECNSIESSYLMYLDVNNLCGCAMSQKLPLNGFEWVEELSQFNKDFIKKYDEISKKG